MVAGVHDAQHFEVLPRLLPIEKPWKGRIIRPERGHSGEFQQRPQFPYSFSLTKSEQIRLIPSRRPFSFLVLDYFSDGLIVKLNQLIINPHQITTIAPEGGSACTVHFSGSSTTPVKLSGSETSQLLSALRSVPSAA
jgi:hypothetical protein